LSATTEKPICLVTGASGYLGSCVTRSLEQSGWNVRPLTRNLLPGSSAIRFQLGEEISTSSLTGARALVHCAYDFKQIAWRDVHDINVAGSEKLLGAAREAKIDRLIYISSISAYEGCRSLYGKAKLETENIARSLGAVSIRPGLIWSESPGAMFGRLIHQVENARVLPLFGGGSQIQYMIHEQDLSQLICRLAAGALEPPSEILTVAHEQPWTFRKILEEIARAKQKRIFFVPVPWRLLWVAIKCAELCHVRLNFKSDSLVSLMSQNPSPKFTLLSLGMNFRPFRLG